LRAEAPDQLVALRGSVRWVRRIFPMPLASRPDGEMPPWIRDDGVYLVTGGLGGIGLTIAGHLAGHKRVRLALLSREGLPAEQHWDDILADGANSRVAGRIRQVRSLRALGAEVMLPVADVADEAALRNALDKVRAIWGPLTGVIHAAGAMDDDPVMAKSAERMLSVLAPKVAGTLALDKAIHEPLDWFILISSVASFLGLAGQVDYTAANAFLDAFARARSTRARGRTVVINWNAWQDIGMAAASHRDLSGSAAPAYPSRHPALDGFTDLGDRRMFVRDFHSGQDWLLDEHRIKNGPALLSGTTFVELARAVVAETRPGQSVMLSNVTFLSPFHVPDGEPRRLTIEMTPLDGGYAIAMRSDPALPPHVECEASFHSEPRPPALDLAAIGAACHASRFSPADGFLNQDFMTFGRRWANIREVRLGASQALIELSLDTPFAPDIDAGYVLHPALLDMATGGVQQLIPGFDPDADFYVPLAYAKITVHGPMPVRLFSHVRCRPESGDGIAYFDIVLSDPDGAICAEIAQFTMKRLDRQSAFAIAPKTRSATDTSRQNALAAVLREAIKPDEGLQALDRIMAQPRLIQVIASSVDVELWCRQLETEATARGDHHRGLDGFERPDLATAFTAPESHVEKTLAKMWCDLLGIQQVGVHDGFFDLGGNSLVAVRLFAAIKREFGISLPLATLFEASTIAELKQLLTERGARDETSPAEKDAAAPEPAPKPSGPTWSPIVKIKAGGADRTPLFCVHGAGGNVMNFRPLAQSLPADLPFYALQAQGIDGELPFHESIDDMATSYLEAIRKIRPAGPYRLAGYSGGGIVALEIAQRLSRSGHDIELLVMLDSLAPAETQKRVTLSEKLAAIRDMEFKNLVQFPAQRLKGWLHHRRVERARDGQAHTNIDHLEIISTNAMGAFWRSQQRYEPESYAGNIVVYRAIKTGALFHRAGPTLGWNKVVRGNIDVMHLNAWHDTLFQSPSLEPLSADLSQRIAQLDRRPVQVPEKARERA
ncbi:MAG: SDR family NAD(P)-dependent oxidoreductase, partial [Tardiphaga sp.]